MSREPELRLTVPALAENVAVIRQALTAVGEATGLSETATGDLKTVVTEAAMNAVVHAYDDRGGPLEVTATRDGDALEVVVRDEGVGFRPRPADPGKGELRLGLPLIAALSDGFEIRGGPGDGTEVRIRKRILVEEGEELQPEPPHRAAPAQTTMSFATDAPIRAVVSRVIGALAARADLSIDRLSDSQLLGDAVSEASVGEFTDGRVDVSITDRAGCIELHLGPLVEGGADRVLERLELPGSFGTLRALASDVSVDRDPEGGERLVIRIEDARGGE